MRELWGKYWIFAHNGTLNGFAPRLHGRFTPVGATDGELAFCCILEAMREALPGGMPDVNALVDLLDHVNAELSRHGVFNYLLSDGDLLFAHRADRVFYVLRNAPFTTAHLLDEDIEVDFSRVTTPDDRVAVIATAPLTDNESWTPLVSGELAVFRDGDRLMLG